MIGLANRAQKPRDFNIVFFFHLFFMPVTSLYRLHLEKKTKTKKKKSRKCLITHLRLHQHQINKQHHKIVLDVFIRKPSAPRTLHQPYVDSGGGSLSAATAGFHFPRWPRPASGNIAFIRGSGRRDRRSGGGSLG